MFSCCSSGREYKHYTPQEASRPQTYRCPSDEMSLAPEPVTGRRRPSNVAQRQPTQSITAPSDRDKDRVEPTDYLYFGEGSSGYHPRYTAAISKNQQGSPSDDPTRIAQRNPSGRDNSSKSCHLCQQYLLTDGIRQPDLWRISAV
jgi:hypothetical protein